MELENKPQLYKWLNSIEVIFGKSNASKTNYIGVNVNGQSQPKLKYLMSWSNLFKPLCATCKDRTCNNGCYIDHEYVCSSEEVAAAKAEYFRRHPEDV